MHLHLDKVKDLVGFVAENVKNSDTAKVITRAVLTSDDPQFYLYTEQISNTFLNERRIMSDGVYQFLVVIHPDASADLYVNDFAVTVNVRFKRDVKKGGAIMQSDIADMQGVNFPDISIEETDKVVYCFKIGWRFGLFFDLAPRVIITGSPIPIKAEKLEIEKMKLAIGELRRYLTFYHVYKVLESDSQFEEMMNDGWFPFVEIVSDEYKKLSAIYENKFNFEERIDTIIKTFSKERIEKMTSKWWKNEIFADKKSLIEAGVQAYMQNTPNGYINCIKNLWTEIEGILRKIYHADTGKADHVKSKDLMNHIIDKAKKKTGSDYSLLLPLPFLKYLEEIVFPIFNVESGQIKMSRNTSSHGIAKTDEYTQVRALQLILILDQIYFSA